MVRSLDTIFHGLADTYRHQGRRGSQGEPGQGAFAQDDPDREREPDYGPGRRLYPRDANGPQPMAPPFGTLGEYVPFLFILSHGRCDTNALIVYLTSSARTLAVGLEVLEALEEGSE